MTKNGIYLLGLSVLVLSATGCASSGTKWMCMERKPGYVSNHCDFYPVGTSQEVVNETGGSAKNLAAVEATPAPAPEPTPIVQAPEVVPTPDQSIPEPTPQGVYNYGDYRSETLTIKAWQALQDRDLNAVLAYTNKCISLYGTEATKMQKSLSDYPVGDQNIFSYWALNDVATCLYIKGEALRRVKKMDDAKESFNRIINEFSYAQTYDTGKKTFWKPIDGAHDSIFMIDNDLDLYYGDMTSNFLVQQMWQALHDKNLNAVIGYDMKLEHLYRDEALDMNKSLKDYPAGNNDDIFKYWALNDVGTGAFIVGEAYRMSNKNDDAIKAYNKVASDYLYAECWDPQGWFWRPAEVAQQKIVEIQAEK